MSDGTYSDYLPLRRGDPPPPDTHEKGVRVYADPGGALRFVQSDGTDAAIGSGGGGSLPTGGTTGEVLTKASDSEGDADWEAPGGGSMPFTLVTVPLSNAEILACHTAPVEIVSAPGPGKVIMPLYAMLYTIGVTTGYTIGGSIGIMVAGVLYTDWRTMLGQTEPAIDLQVNAAAGVNLVSILEDGSVTFAAQGADPTDGDGSAVLTLAYLLADTA